MTKKSRETISRRDLLTSVTLAGVAATTVAVLPVATTPERRKAAADKTGAQTSEGYEHLTTDEATLLETIVDELIPTEEHGPGARDARVVRYIDRGLGGALSGFQNKYHEGLANFDRYCRLAHGTSFLELSQADRVTVLTTVEAGSATGFSEDSSVFFAMVRRHVLEGMFGDPYYGGNHDFVGWDLLGYPGVRTAVTPAAQQRLEANELQPNHRSAYDWETFTKASAQLSLRDPQHGD